MYARKNANRANPIREYSPEHATSIVRDISCPDEVVRYIIGLS